MNKLDITPNRNEISSLEAFCCYLAREAGKKALEVSKQDSSSIAYKTHRDLVTQADIQCEKMIIDGIKGYFPDDIILAEESSNDLESALVESSNCWIIDPIDGTMNFAHRQPHTSISIAYSEKGTVKAGAVYGMFYDELFSASLGLGARLNGKEIPPTNSVALNRAIVCCGRPHHDDFIDEFSAQIGNIYKNCLDLRRLGSAALDICWIALARHHVFFETVNPWDIAAASLIAREAGVLTGHYQSQLYSQDTAKYQRKAWPNDIDANFFLATSPGIFDEINQILSKTY